MALMGNMIQYNPGDDYETDNSFEEAKTITIGENQQRSIHLGTDEDYVSIHLVAGNLYEFCTRYSNFNNLDTVLYLYDSNQVQIAFDDNGLGQNASITYDCGQSGTYYLKVASYNGQTGNYELCARNGISWTTADSFEPDNQMASAGTILVDSDPQDRSLHVNSDIDYIEFTGTAGQPYTISASASWDILDMNLLDSNGTVIDSGWIHSPIHFTPSQTGSFYILIQSYNGRVDDYSIQVQSGLLSLQFNDSIGREK